MNAPFIQASQNVLSVLCCKFSVKDSLHCVASSILKSLNNRASSSQEKMLLSHHGLNKDSEMRLHTISQDLLWKSVAKTLQSAIQI